MQHPYFEQQYRVTGPDGTVVYQGSGAYNGLLAVTSAETTATIAQDEAVRITTASTIIAPSTNAAASGYLLKVERTASADQTLMVGVASLGPILPAKTGWLVSAGSIVPVRSTATGAIGGAAQSSATAAMVTTGGTVAISTKLGYVCKAVAAYNSVNMVGVYVNPGGI